MSNVEWTTLAIKMDEAGMSWREIATMLGKPKSTISDHLRKYNRFKAETEAQVPPTPEPVRADTEGVFRIQTDPTKEEGVHLFISDTQVKPGVPLDYLSWLGKYIVRKQPDVIVLAGDHADMPSLSSYDKGKKAAEGKRVNEDIAAAIEGMKVLLEPLYQMQQADIERLGYAEYKPRLVITIGNHEDRIDRHVNSNPELEGFLSIDDLCYSEFGWEVYPFLTPVEIGGIYYCHYFPNVMTGKALTGTSANMLKVIGRSFTMGHRQLLDVSTRFLQSDGTQQWGIVAGSYYDHQEGYKGVQGNHHWRGVILKHNVRNGSYDPLFVSLDWLRKEYEGS